MRWWQRGRPRTLVTIEQYAGFGTSISLYRSSSSAFFFLKYSLSGMTVLCRLTTAPIWLLLGREWKYRSDSSSGSRFTEPSIRTCRLRGSQ